MVGVVWFLIATQQRKSNHLCSCARAYIYQQRTAMLQSELNLLLNILLDVWRMVFMLLLFNFDDIYIRTTRTHAPFVNDALTRRRLFDKDGMICCRMRMCAVRLRRLTPCTHKQPGFLWPVVSGSVTYARCDALHCTHVFVDRMRVHVHVVYVDAPRGPGTQLHRAIARQHALTTKLTCVRVCVSNSVRVRLRCAYVCIYRVQCTLLIYR